MNEANDLCTPAGHANGQSLAERLEASQYNRFGQYMEHEGQKFKGSADIGIIGQGGPRVGVCLCESLKELGKPRDLDVNVYN